MLVDELPTLRKFTYSLTGSVDDTNDLVQTAVERCLKSGIPADGARPWMFRVCKNLWIDELRRRGRKPGVEFNEEIDTELPTFSTLNESEQDLARQDKLQRLARAMERLSEDQRIALSMAAIEGMSYEEISVALDVPLGTVMSRIARARVTLGRLTGGLNDDQ